MKCPTCPDSTLLISSREGIEIDYCPACRGVWLDRGELDKIIERSMALPGTSAQGGRVDCDDDRARAGGHGRRRRGFLGDLFD